MAVVVSLPELLLVPPPASPSSSSTPPTPPALTSVHLLNIGFLVERLPVAKLREVLVPVPRNPVVVPLVRLPEGMEIDGDRLSEFPLWVSDLRILRWRQP
jgi:hypothetical protein